MNARSSGPSRRGVHRPTPISKSCCERRFRYSAARRCKKAREHRAAEAEMVRFVWEFVARADRVQDFERYYANSGPWAELFGRNPGYRGTVLLRDAENARRFLTIDAWDNASAYRAMRERFAKEYEELDRRCEAFTESERRIGEFEER